jgi:hypothetical protein
MNKSVLKALLYGITAIVLMQSCNDKDDPPPAPPVITGQSFTQGFESMAAAQTQGWIFKYQSNDPDFTHPWSVETVAGAPEGTHALFSWNDYLNNGNSHDVDSSISNWAISPVRWFQNGDSIIFYTYSTGRTEPVVHPWLGYEVADRLQLRMTRLDSTSNTGTTSSDVGSFTFPLIDVNPNLHEDGYPATWTRYAAMITGLNHPIQGRFAIRYYVPDFWNNGWGVYVDKVEFKSVTP